MRFSQLNTDQAADVLCELTPYIANITGDKKLLDELAKKFDMKGKSTAELYVFAAQKLANILPVVLKDHKEDIFGILAVLNDTTPEAVSKQSVFTTIKQARDVLADKELLSFFKSLQQPEESE